MNEDLFLQKETINQDTLLQLKKLCDEYSTISFEIEKKEDELKAKKQTLENLSRNLIPALLGEYNLSEIKLSSGEKVMVQDKLKSSITNTRIDSVYKNMIEEEGEDKVNSLFQIQTFIEDSSTDTLNLLLENSIPYELKKFIHWQTLNKYCKEKLAQGEKIPDGISVFQYQETQIKK